jgi:hypothetical protein
MSRSPCWVDLLSPRHDASSGLVCFGHNYNRTQMAIALLLLARWGCPHHNAAFSAVSLLAHPYAINFGGNSTVCCDVTTCRRFGGTYCLHLQCRKVRSSEISVNLYQTTRRHISGNSTLICSPFIDVCVQDNTVIWDSVKQLHLLNINIA